MPVIFIYFFLRSIELLMREGNWSGLLVEINYSLVCYIFSFIIERVYTFDFFYFFLAVNWSYGILLTFDTYHTDCRSLFAI